MTQYHEGQDVWVTYPQDSLLHVAVAWRTATIVNELFQTSDWPTKSARYEVQFPDGTRAVFDVKHIRAGEPAK